MVRRRSPAHQGAPFDFSRRHHWGLRSATALEGWAWPGALWERGPEPTARQVLRLPLIVPRFEHLLIDQTQQSPDSVPGALAARLAQVAMMAAFRQAREELLESATRLMGELYRAMGFDEVTKHVEYVLATQPDEYCSVFVDALRRNVPGRGGDVMNYVEQLIERGRQEGRREGRLEGKIRTIEGLLERDIPWSSIEAATGIDEAAFRKFKRQLDATDDGANT